LKDLEFSSFKVSSEIPGEIVEREDDLRARYALLEALTIKVALNRILDKKLSLATGKRVDVKDPDLKLTINLFEDKILIQIKPLFIYGRYKKLKRGIPQAKWICVRCNGRGCPHCWWIGKMYPESVEELISSVLLKETEAKNSLFHGAGREDVDALMLGNGRPFIIELIAPRKRSISLVEAEKKINNLFPEAVQISSLSFTNRRQVEVLKSMAEKTRKTYRAVVFFEDIITDEDLKLLSLKLSNTRILQRTPTRVLHRRADKLRIKKVYNCNAEKISDNIAILIITADGGLYIKELINVDNGRTRPSVSEILNKSCQCKLLEVLETCVGEQK